MITHQGSDNLGVKIIIRDKSNYIFYFFAEEAVDPAVGNDSNLGDGKDTKLPPHDEPNMMVGEYRHLYIHE